MRNRKFIYFLMACSILGGTLSASTFSDVANTHWAYKSIEHVRKAGIMTTTTSGEFKPNAYVTYFNACVALARATGYRDTDTIKDDEELKQAILNNYQKQLPIINKYSAKYSSWDKTANEEIAYLLGRGYIKESEFDKFITSSGNRGVLRKQDLAVWIVRMIQKEETAKKTYTKTGFTDELFILEENRPHVAYLKQIGLVKGDSVNNTFGANVQITRALCAKMLSDGVLYLENQNTAPTYLNGTVKKVMEKNAECYYVLMDQEGKTNFYSMKKSTLVSDGTKTMDLSKLALNTPVSFQTQVIEGTEFIVKMDVASMTVPTEPSKVTQVQGVVQVVNGDNTFSIQTLEGTINQYEIGTSTLTYKGEAAASSLLTSGASVRLTLEKDMLKAIEIVSLPSSSTETDTAGDVVGEISALTETADSIKVQVLDKTILLSKDTVIKRNGKSASCTDLKLGDKITISYKESAIKDVSATSTTGISKGKIKSILLAKQPQLTIETATGDKVFNIMPKSELYSNVTRENISIRDLKLGQSVEVSLESKEVLSIVVQEAPTSIIYKGKIVDTMSGGKSIGVVVDYDAVSNETQTFKRIDIPQSVVISNGKEVIYRTSLKVGMDIVITFKNHEDLIPEKILILN